MKLCANCRHCSTDYWGLKCSHPTINPKDYATGERPYADHTRRMGFCGVDGRLFESRTPAPNFNEMPLPPKPPKRSLLQRLRDLKW